VRPTARSSGPSPDHLWREKSTSVKFTDRVADDPRVTTPQIDIDDVESLARPDGETVPSVENLGYEVIGQRPCRPPALGEPPLIRLGARGNPNQVRTGYLQLTDIAT